jgi:putative addiction module killer protein
LRRIQRAGSAFQPVRSTVVCRSGPCQQQLTRCGHRVRFQKGIGPGYRVYLVPRGETLCVVLCGGDKSTQQKDIERAKRLARELED